MSNEERERLLRRVETFKQFEEYLYWIASLDTNGSLFYHPIAKKFSELYGTLKWRLRFALLLGVALGMLLAVLMKLVGVL